MVDWDLAVATGQRLVRPGPVVGREEAREIVDELRAGAKESEGHVREYTGLHADTASAPIAVIDREGWVQANADGFRVLMRPLVEKVTAKRTPSAASTAVGSRITGFEAGALLGYLAGKVLGQFDPFWDGDQPGTAGRLLLVAPNIVHVERQLAVDPHDFRLWVCLHEETHRVQFTAVPWLREHLRGEIQELVDATSLDPADLTAMAKDGLERAIRLARGDQDVSVIDLFQTPEQRAVVDRITAAMSLLEGHADVVMDGVGPDVIPTVDTIRTKFNQRRQGGGTLDQLLRRLLGFDAKMRQYRDGAKFVRGVVDEVGMDGFNRVWSSPEALPSKPEIGDPAAWVRRVHG
ncbi:MAG: coenzyme F420 biosynthesis-associated protein [Propionibacteriales bacterium]|nr:coenzyme F420 biosynthesis-associated protein [Propionibacteriales bacterium]